MKLNELIHSEEYSRCIGNTDIEISRISVNTDTYAPDTLLILLKRTSAPEDLIGRFSAIICSEEDFDSLSAHSNFTVIAAKSVRAAWAFAESRIRSIDYSRMRFIGVTGTNGKTTTATLISFILRHTNKQAGFIGTGKILSGESRLSAHYYSMTTPDPPILYEAIKRMERDGVEYVVMEASSHALYYEKLAPISFEVAVFTNISPEHLDFHKTMAEYIGVKMRLCERSRLSLYNNDDPYLRRAFENTDVIKRSFGILWGGDSRATDVNDKGFGGLSFIYREKSFSFIAASSLVGKFNIYNILSALSAAISLGIKPCEAKSALKEFNGVDGRIETVHNADIRIIIDYAHTEVGMDALLASVRGYTDGKLTVLFGCGGERYVEKRAAMGSIAEKYADKIYVTSDNPRKEDPMTIISNILSGISSKERCKVIINRDEAIRKAIHDAENGETILLIGKGEEKYNLDGNGYHPFDEREIVKRAISERGGNI